MVTHVSRAPIFSTCGRRKSAPRLYPPRFPLTRVFHGMKLPTVATIALTVLVSPSLTGHGGGLDKNGCHTNRKTGDYHCHGGGGLSSSAPAPAPAIRPASAVTVHSASPTSREGDLIRAAQVLLRALGYSPTMLGTLDERTLAAVRGFQRAENITADGVVTEFLVLRLAEKVSAKCN